MHNSTHACAPRGRLRDDLITALGYAADLELPDWPPLVGCVEAAIGQLRAALALVEGGETRSEHLTHRADVEYGVERPGRAASG